MDELTERIDDLLIAQADMFVEQLRELLAHELGGAVARQFGVTGKTPLWSLEGSLQRGGMFILFVAEVSPAVREVR